MDEREQQLAEVKARLRFRVPGLKKSIGSGDVVRKVTEALGIEHCSDCDRRKDRMNRFLQFESYLEEQEPEPEPEPRLYDFSDNDIDYGGNYGGRGWD